MYHDSVVTLMASPHTPALGGLFDQAKRIYSRLGTASELSEEVYDRLRMGYPLPVTQPGRIS